MSAARTEILARIRRALVDRPEPEPAVRNYRTSGPVDVELFVERLLDYQATVFRADRVGSATSTGSAAADRVREAVGERRRLIVPAGFPAEWLARLRDEPAVELISDEPALSVAELDSVDGVLTSCAIAVAETGTIVLDAGPGQGRRALTLVPDYHLVVVRTSQLVGLVPEAVAALDPVRPLTWISGPSATSDIELSRVEGVHGPRTLHVIVLDEAR